MAEERVQRRLAAILAADVEGYSRLMGEDEEGTLASLTAHRTELIEPCIAEHRGRVVKTTGDGLLAEFASVVDAVCCAVAFQEGMRERNGDIPEDRRIQFRIGINLGDVIVQDDDVFGDGVNIAARLEGLAEPNGVCVSDMVHQSVRSKLDLSFDDLGPQRVKNIGDPVHAFHIRHGAPSGASSTGQGDALPLPDRPSIAVLPFDRSISRTASPRTSSPSSRRSPVCSSSRGTRLSPTRASR
jgi:adenylate cyclase